MDSKCPRVSGETHRQLVPLEGFLALLGQTSTPNTNWFTVRIPSLSANHWKFTDALSSPSVSCRMKENIDKIVFAASSIIKGVRSSLLTSPLSSLLPPPPSFHLLLRCVVSSSLLFPGCSSQARRASSRWPSFSSVWSLSQRRVRVSTDGVHQGRIKISNPVLNWSFHCGRTGFLTCQMGAAGGWYLQWIQRCIILFQKWCRNSSSTSLNLTILTLILNSEIKVRGQTQGAHVLVPQVLVVPCCGLHRSCWPITGLLEAALRSYWLWAGCTSADNPAGKVCSPSSSSMFRGMHRFQNQK